MSRPPKPIDATFGEYTKQAKKEREKAEKEIDGEVGKNKIKTPPKNLTRNGKAIYRALVEDLEKSGININNLDVYMLELLANSIDNMRMAQDRLNKEGTIIEYTNKGGNTNLIQNPALGAYLKYYKIFKDCCSDLGLSPSARAKLALLKVNNDKEKDDPLLRILSDDDEDVI